MTGAEAQGDEPSSRTDPSSERVCKTGEGDQGCSDGATKQMASMPPMLNLNGSPGKMDMLLHFETLHSDFAALDNELGIETEATLPHKDLGYA